ncbi:hypothetical protein, partial [Oceanospirillum multiglobuliferum]
SNVYDSDSSDESILHIRNVEVYKNEMLDEWWEEIKIGQSKLMCQLDTGARACVMSEKDLMKVEPSVKLKVTNKKLISYSKHQIKPRGSIHLRVQYKDIKLLVKSYIIEGDHVPVLSGATCKALNLVKRIHILD